MQGPKDAHLHFLNTFIVLTFTFRTWSHSESVSVYGVRQGLCSYFCVSFCRFFKAAQFGFLHYLSIPALCSGPLESSGPCLTSLPLNPAAGPKLGEM